MTLCMCYRNTGPEGWRLRQRHFEAITSLVRSCRRFFPPGSAFEIWSEFRSVLSLSLSLILLICLEALIFFILNFFPHQQDHFDFGLYGSASFKLLLACI
jgi:hypothetical protein